ncbi:MAG: DNA cytosine methyltransferase [Burkholderiaceae bacterium]
MRFLSLFSGIEAASVAWIPLGWTCAGVAEIEPFPCVALKHHYPNVPNLGDVTHITEAQIAALGPIDLVCGGSPCQDLSVAGKRAGLAGERSNLFYEQMRIFNAARRLCGARFMLWENVPGAFSSNRGADFAAVAGEMAGARFGVPHGGWRNTGVAAGRNGLVEWATLDAQWFGLAQRRKRVFALLDTGNWADRPPILFEPESLRRDSAPRRKAGQDAAGTLTARARGGLPRNAEFNQKLIPQTAMCLNAGAMRRQDAESETLIPTLAHTLRGEGFDASEDGTGRGTPLVPVIGFACKASGSNGFGVGEVAGTMKARHDGHLACFSFDTQQITSAANRSRVGPELPAPTLSTRAGSMHVATHMVVRRLTPKECARLQGFPDEYLDIAINGKPAADGPKYKALGNSWAVPVAQWIGKQIQRAVSAEGEARCSG